MAHYWHTFIIFIKSHSFHDDHLMFCFVLGFFCVVFICHILTASPWQYRLTLNRSMTQKKAGDSWTVRHTTSGLYSSRGMFSGEMNPSILSPVNEPGFLCCQETGVCLTALCQVLSFGRGGLRSKAIFQGLLLAHWFLLLMKPILLNFFTQKYLSFLFF